MTDKELKKLSRADLLEMMLALSRENEQLRKENIQLQKQLSDRTVAIENAGSLAEAVLQLNGVAEAAQAACEQYLYNIRERSANLEQLCQQKEQQTREKCDQMIAQAQKQAEEYLQAAQQKLREQNSSYNWLAELMNDGMIQE